MTQSLNKEEAPQVAQGAARGAYAPKEAVGLFTLAEMVEALGPEFPDDESYNAWCDRERAALKAAEGK